MLSENVRDKKKSFLFLKKRFNILSSMSKQRLKPQLFHKICNQAIVKNRRYKNSSGSSTPLMKNKQPPLQMC
jgi:hypothetical protein